MKDFTKEIENSVEAFYQLEELSSKNKLFCEKKSIHLKITLFKVPIVNGIRKKYLKLRHSRFGDNPETCLFVPNRKSGLKYKITNDEEIDLTVDYYKDFLEKHNVEGIKTIMPLKQLKTEYSSFELKRKLVDRFDLFLCKTSLLFNHRFTAGLGKIFFNKNKLPLGISFPAWDAPTDPKFKENIQRALLSTTLHLRPFADNYSLPIGTVSHPKSQIKENLLEILEQIQSDELIPGGFKNVRALYIHSSNQKSIPLYICEDIPKNLGTIRLKRTKKRVKKTTGLLSTLGKKVTVKNDGTVIIKSKSNKSYNLDYNVNSDEEEDTELVEENNDDYIPDVANVKKSREHESESEDDLELEKKEKRLLKMLEKRNNRKKDRDNNDDGGDDDDDDDEEEETNEKIFSPTKKRKKIEKQSNKGKFKKTKGAKEKTKISFQEKKLIKAKKKEKLALKKKAKKENLISKKRAKKLSKV